VADAGGPAATSTWNISPLHAAGKLDKGKKTKHGDGKDRNKRESLSCGFTVAAAGSAGTTSLYAAF